MQKKQLLIRTLGAVLLVVLILASGCRGIGGSSDSIKTHSTSPADMDLIQHNTDMYEILVLDNQTGRGVPLVQFTTTDGKHTFVTDSAGRAAINVSILMNKLVIFDTLSHGYRAPMHTKGVYTNPMRGRIKLPVIPGRGDVIRIERINIAERMYRLTGEGIYRDSVMLGYPVPIEKPLRNGEVSGQDTGGSIVYKGKVFWSYGDTGRLDSPWWGGTWRSPMATSELPENGGLDPAIGVNLNYFTRPDGFVKDMYPASEFGGAGHDPEYSIVWPVFVDVIDGNLYTFYTGLVSDGQGWVIEKEKGMAVFNDAKEHFERVHVFDINETWRMPNSWGTFRYFANGREWLYLGHTTFPNKRVPPDIESIKDLTAYEAWSCLEDGSGTDPATARLLRDEDGRLIYRWTKNAPPISPADEKEFIAYGLMDESEAFFLPVDVETGKLVKMHTGTVFFNEYRQKWIYIGGEDWGSPSLLGEIWYSEADEPTGPWRKAIKIVTHDAYSLYNPHHLHWFDQEGGRIIYFDGAYTYSFSGSEESKTPLYDYNMMMYRLDLGDPRMMAAYD